MSSAPPLNRETDLDRTRISQCIAAQRHTHTKMIEVEWKYRGDAHDRLLVLLPPLHASTAASSILKKPEMLLHYRKTLTNLCTNETLKYIIVYVPFFDPSSYEQRCLFEEVYGRELRLISSLDKLLDRHFPEYMTNECVYMLKNPDEWSVSTLPMEWFFDTVISDQLYDYYDTTSKWMHIELKKYAEHSVGASWVYESVLSKVQLLCDEGELAGIISPQEKDLVLILGDIEPDEQRLYLTLIRSLAGHHHITAIYSYGNMTAHLEEFQDDTSIHCSLRSQPTMTQDDYTDLTNALNDYSPSYTSFLWLGTFATEGAQLSHSLEPDHTRAFIYQATTWCSLFENAEIPVVPPTAPPVPPPTSFTDALSILLSGGGGAGGENSVKKPSSKTHRPPIFTYEPLGLLKFFLDNAD